jgi:hypothetical protein
MFSKKLASRADETPTFGSAFSDHGLGGQTKTLKTEGFSMFCFWLQNLDDHTRPEEAMKNAKQQFYLTNRKVLMQTTRKLNTFHYFLGHCLGPDLPSYLPYGEWSAVFFIRKRLPVKPIAPLNHSASRDLVVQSGPIAAHMAHPLLAPRGLCGWPFSRCGRGPSKHQDKRDPAIYIYIYIYIYVYIYTYKTYLCCFF